MSQTYEDKLTLEAWNGKLGRIPLMTYTVEEDTTEFSIDVTGIDWADYAVVAMVIIPSPGSAGTMYFTPKERSTDTCSYVMMGGGGTHSPYFMAFNPNTAAVAFFLPFSQHDLQVCALGFSGGSCMYGWAAANFATVRTIEFNGLVTMPAGSQIKFIGIR